MFVSNLCIFGDVSVRIFGKFINSVICFLYDFYELFVYIGYKFFMIYGFKKSFLPVCNIQAYYLIHVFHIIKVFDCNKFQQQFVLSWIMFLMLYLKNYHQTKVT